MTIVSFDAPDYLVNEIRAAAPWRGQSALLRKAVEDYMLTHGGMSAETKKQILQRRIIEAEKELLTLKGQYQELAVLIEQKEANIKTLKANLENVKDTVVVIPEEIQKEIDIRVEQIRKQHKTASDFMEIYSVLIQKWMKESANKDLILRKRDIYEYVRQKL